MGNWDEAIKNYKEAIKMNPQDDLSYNGLGNAYFGLRLYSKAIEQYEMAKSITEHPIYFSNIGDANRRLKKWDKAIEYYQLAIKKAKEANTSDEIFRNSLGLAYNDRGVEFYEKKEDDKAIADYKEAIKFNSEDPVIHHNLYLVYNAKNMYKEADKSLHKAIELDPNNPIYAEELKALGAKIH
jgi:tetratricopeptide (TPR) repeat protein